MDILEKINQEVKEAGGKAYFVGGYVRDFLLGSKASDIDVEIHNLEKGNLKNILNEITPFEEVGHFGIFIAPNHPELEISIPREELKVKVGYLGFDIKINPYMGLKKAASRRDFTINALYMEVGTNKVIDVIGGMDDLQNKVLRHITSAFAEDPLRVLRGFKFTSRLGFEIDEKTKRLMEQISPELHSVSKDRIKKEFTEIITGPYFSNNLTDFLKVTRAYFDLHWFLKVTNPFIQGKSETVNQTLVRGFKLIQELKQKENLELNQRELHILYFSYFFHLFKVGCSDSLKAYLSAKFGDGGKFYGDISNIVTDYQKLNSFSDITAETKVQLIYKYQSKVGLASLVASIISTVEGNKEHLGLDSSTYDKWNKIYLLYQGILKEYNGHYFISRGIEGKEIKEAQHKLFLLKVEEL